MPNADAVPVQVTEPLAPPVVRSPSDVLRSVTAAALLVALLLLGALLGDQVTGFVADLLAGVDALGAALLTAVVVGTRLLVVVVVLAGLGATVVTYRWRLLATGIGAAALGPCWPH